MKKTVLILILTFIGQAGFTKVLPVSSRPISLSKGQYQFGVDLEIGVIHDRSLKDFYIYAHRPLKPISGLWARLGLIKHLELGIGLSPYIKDRRGTRFGGMQGYIRWAPITFIGLELGVRNPAWGLTKFPTTSTLGSYAAIPFKIEISRGSFALSGRIQGTLGWLPHDNNLKSPLFRLDVEYGFLLNLSNAVALEVLSGFRKVIRPDKRTEIPVSLVFSYTFKNAWEAAFSLDFWNLRPDNGLPATHYKGFCISIDKYW